MIDRLPDLPAMRPEPVDTDRVRRRCHALLTRPNAPTESRADAAFITASAAYLLLAVLHLLAFFRP